ncbi:hypothetical protein DMC30DRAFT_157304 [Rhodotorula diobovata]|uniref:Uncharacterized protein n=1 Tax=Rhodotorula diobovata TaxID=5288 RepID=A0A5C5FZH8_9BASI|nr:hypothetical protein DMC30DRAFT_157304 [Rhodotorula diobovata]
MLARSALRTASTARASAAPRLTVRSSPSPFPVHLAPPPSRLANPICAAIPTRIVLGCLKFSMLTSLLPHSATSSREQPAASPSTRSAATPRRPSTSQEPSPSSSVATSPVSSCVLLALNARARERKEIYPAPADLADPPPASLLPIVPSPRLQSTPPTPAVKNMQEAMHPKTPEAKTAAVRSLLPALPSPSSPSLKALTTSRSLPRAGHPRGPP